MSEARITNRACSSAVSWGPEHEYMGGTVKRTDLVAAFGGTRAPPTTPGPAMLRTSYELQASALRTDWGALRRTNARAGFASAVAYGDFDGDGDEDVFVSSGDDTVNATPVEMYLNEGADAFRLDNGIFQGAVPGLVHPRKAIAGDFNGDGRLDIFVAGHGYDKPPFAGESPRVAPFVGERPQQSCGP